MEVYRNGSLLGTRDVTAWPYYASTGYVGLWFESASGTLVDDFGGGTVTTLQMAMEALRLSNPTVTLMLAPTQALLTSTATATGASTETPTPTATQDLPT